MEPRRVPFAVVRRRATRVSCATLIAALAFLGPRAAEAQHDHEAAGSGLTVAPQLNLHGFSDVTAWARHLHTAAGDSVATGFGLGQFDLYFVSRLAENLSFLGETVFEINEQGEGVVDVERAFIKYSWSDFAHLAAGRTHTALGYWNEAFHHGTLLQPTVERPEALKFEDDGGILPVHSVGLELSGGTRLGPWGLSYVANLANGRGLGRESVQNGGDLNHDKALGMKLTVSRDGPVEFEFGPAFHRDRIPADPGTPGRDQAITEQIPGLHVSGRTADVTVLAEYYRVRHQDRVNGTVWNHDAGYLIATANRGRFRPYGGFDRLDYAVGDPFFVGNDTDLTRAIAGVRFEFDTFDVVKLEFRHDWRPGERDDALLVQTAFTF